MQTRICEICLKSDFLCSTCQEKLDNGEVSKMEIDISRFLYRLSDKMKSLRDVKIVNIIDSEAILIITRRGDAAKLVGKKGSVVKLLAKEFNKSIRVIEEMEDFKRFAKELISPITIKGINTLYTLGNEVYKVRVSTLEKNRLILSPESFSNIISNLYDRKAEIVFEN